MPTRRPHAGSVRRPTYHILAAAVLVALARSASAAGDAAESGEAGDAWKSGFTEAVLEVAVNERQGGEMLVVMRDSLGHVWLEAADFTRLNLNVPRKGGRVIGGKTYYPILGIARLGVDFDEATQHLDIKAPPEAFELSRFAAAPRRGADLTPADPGGFVNYQLYEQRIAGEGATGAQLELGAFARYGVITSTSVSRDAAGTESTVRLDTTFTHDFPDRLETLTVGDAINDPGSWGNSVRYGGIHFGRNFGIRPDLITTPMLTTGGMAVVPSTVDVFVNSQRASSQNVPSGPFVIDNVPAVSGQGDVRVVVRDALGREETLTQAFYSSPLLLAPDFTQFSVDLGRARENYAITSADYGAAIGSGTYRRGLSDSLTAEVHGEFEAGAAHALGLNAAKLIDTVGVASGTLAVGGDSAGTGVLAGVGFEHREKKWSVVFNTSYATEHFQQLANDTIVTQAFRTRSLVQGSLDFGRLGSLAVADVFEGFRSGGTQNTVSASWNYRITDDSSLNMTLSTTTGTAGPSSKSGFLTYTLALGSRRAFTTTATGGSGSGAPPNELYASLIENPPIGPGYGYRLAAGTAGDYDADWKGQFAPADVEVEAARSDGIAGQSLYVRGAATLLDGVVHASRQVTSSFAVVDVGGLPGIPVYLDNQLVTTTDASGKALLYNLRAYEDNRINIAPEELPLDTDIAARAVTIAPAYRSGVVARFPVTRIHGATFRLVQESGAAVPAGAVVGFGGGSFPVAIDGATYVTNLEHGATGEATWPGGACRFEAPDPPAATVQPDLGTLTCRRVTP